MYLLYQGILHFNHVGTHSFHFLSHANDILHLLVGKSLNRSGSSDENKKLHASRKRTQGKLLKSWCYMILQQTPLVSGWKTDHHPSPPMTGSCIRDSGHIRNNWSVNTSEAFRQQIYVMHSYLFDLCKFPLFVLCKIASQRETWWSAKKHTQRGQLLRVRSHFDMQSRWKTCPQLPQAMLRPSSDAEDGFAWYSMLGSCKLLRQIAQVSVQIDQDHTATAFHCHTKAQSREMVSWVWICTHPFYFKVFLICRHGKGRSVLACPNFWSMRSWANNFLLSKQSQQRRAIPIKFHRISISVFWNHKYLRTFVNRYF